MSGLPAAVAALPALRLRRREERRLKAGHLWVFSNEVDTAATPLSAFEPGDPVRIEAHSGQVLGSGYVNPRSLICARVVTPGTGAVLDRALLAARLEAALALRQRLYAEPCYRLIHGEADGLPGLVVDRFADVLVVQVTTAGMERRKEDILAVLGEALAPRGILLRNDVAVRELEGLERLVETVGEVPGEVIVPEGGLRFRVPLHGGQKTGWFFDQRPNRLRAAAHAGGAARVLDVFSYVGAWGLQAAAAGAGEVLCVDASREALARVMDNAAANGLDGRVATRAGDAFDVLRELHAEGERFDLVVVDPPAFIKRRKDIDSGTEAYQRLNQLAMDVLAADGLLVSASCSYHLSGERLQRLLLRAARRLGRRLQILERGGQGCDHPVHPAIPETEYLKVITARVLTPRDRLA